MNGEKRRRSSGRTILRYWWRSYCHFTQVLGGEAGKPAGGEKDENFCPATDFATRQRKSCIVKKRYGIWRTIRDAFSITSSIH